MTFEIQTRLWWRFAIVVLYVLICNDLQARELPRADRPANAVAKSVHDEAVRILESIRTTKYQHKTDIDEEKGSYLCDCSGFVGYVLNRTVGKEGGGALGDGRKRPLAMDYEEFFAAASASRNGNSGWQRITRLADARPGDVIAWRHEKPKPGNTGHVVIVGERPVLEEDGLVRVVTIDSSTIKLDGDNRAEGSTGVGRRVMWFTVDNEGQPVSYIRGSRTAEPKMEAISVGRALRAAKSSVKRPAKQARVEVESK